MKSILIVNGKLVNEGKIIEADILCKDGMITKIGSNISEKADVTIDAKGKYIFPGVIDDQVHFREPGLTHKANIYSEAKAGVAGGTTTFMEMPNTNPQTLTQQLLEDKYKIAENTSLANYSFYIGASNSNYDEVMKTDIKNVCGIKVFMGSSTGDMLVDDEQVLEKLFANAPMLIATHCEDEATVRKNAEIYKAKYPEDAPAFIHPLIRNEEACIKSSSFAIGLAKKFNTRLHILHISTAEECLQFDNKLPLEKKRITSEACTHHLWFDSGDYEMRGNFIKWNPAVKEARHKEAIFKALLDDRIDVLATDHAPHTLEEKSSGYWKAPSGGPLIQHALVAMLEFYKKGKITLERIAEKMAHAPAICFQIEKRGFIREGFWADLAIVDLNYTWKVEKSNILAKCGWSPFEGETFHAKVSHTIVSGHLAYENGVFHEETKGKRLTFDR